MAAKNGRGFGSKALTLILTQGLEGWGNDSRTGSGNGTKWRKRQRVCVPQGMELGVGT